MKLEFATNMGLEETRVLVPKEPLIESGSAPRWSFRYDNFDTDPTPDILLLGAYKNPETENNLVGGINVNYLNKEQINRLAEYLPIIIKGKNLRQRYWLGKKYLPDIFDDFYRTYDSKYIRGARPGIMNPKFGRAKGAEKWLKKKMEVAKPEVAEVRPETEKYPKDLEKMRSTLSKTMQDLVSEPEPRVDDKPKLDTKPRFEPEPEPVFANIKREIEQAEPLGMTVPSDQAADIDNYDAIDGYDDDGDEYDIEMPDFEAPEAPPEEVIEPNSPELQVAKDFVRKIDQAEKQVEIDDDDDDDVIAAQNAETEDPLTPSLATEEFIRYYSPSKKRYVIEKVWI